MKFAKYWEKLEIPVESTAFYDGRTSVSVWGASEHSAEAAIEHAKERAENFKSFIKNDFEKIDTYSYTNGYIKEEIIEEIYSNDGELLGVLSRNYYGALVLNTTRMFIGDIDIDDQPESGLFAKIKSLFTPSKGSEYPPVVERLRRLQQTLPKYTFQIYKTSAGYRVLIVNTEVDANSSEAASLFDAMKVDPLYVHMCKAQSCFRARLTPKPWRIGLEFPGADARFPRSAEHEAAYRRWISNYESTASGYAITQPIASFGNTPVHSELGPLIELHDHYTIKDNAPLA